MTEVLGDSGPAVLLLPGGAESTDGFFPGLAEGLLADPGCRVILHDRPGTGTSAQDSPLADASAHLHALLGDLELGPVVVIGQSLGAAVATLLARDHPADVAGLVLLDASPINDVPSAKRLGQTMRTLLAVGRVPLLGGAVPALMRATVRRTMRGGHDRPDVLAARAKMLEIDVPKLGRSADGLLELARGFRESDLPRVPAVVVTADRKPDAPMRLAHQRLATALDAPLVSWPGAEHAVHLSHPDEVLEVSRTVVRAVAG